MTDNEKALILETIDLMSRVFWNIDAQFSDTLWKGGFDDFFAGLDELLDGEFSPGIEQINKVKNAFATADDLHSELNSTFVRLFVNAKGGLKVPLYQSSYLPGNSGLMGPSSITLKELYQKQGLSQATYRNEPPDHLSIELEYLYFLLKKGWENNDETSIKEAGLFIDEVLNTWVNKLTQTLENSGNTLIYTAMAKALLLLLDFLSKKIIP